MEYQYRTPQRAILVTAPTGDPLGVVLAAPDDDVPGMIARLKESAIHEVKFVPLPVL